MTTPVKNPVLAASEGAKNSPYANLPKHNFWKHGVAERAPLDHSAFYTPRFPISMENRIMTAGSCFAQHVGRTLRNAGYNVLDEEPLPATFYPEDTRKLGFCQYSARYGNVYTTRQLFQLISEAFGNIQPEFPVWEKGSVYFDAQRPGIDPFGFDSPEQVVMARETHLAAVRRAVEKADVFVFTLGLTEAWQHTSSKTVFPTAPGTIAGRFDPEQFSFVNFSYQDVLDDFLSARKLIKSYRPDMRFLLTVSPVPLTATATQTHVEVATCYSKSVLRAVCGHLYATCDDIDYFPSYEIITSQTARGSFYKDNLREVSDQGVATAMSVFMAAQNTGAGKQSLVLPEATEDVACEDALLEAFTK